MLRHTIGNQLAIWTVVCYWIKFTGSPKLVKFEFSVVVGLAVRSNYPVKDTLGKNLKVKEYVSWLLETDMLRVIYFKNECMANITIGKMFSDIYVN